jgi:hypothetical protein
MSYMFILCLGLTSIPLFNTSKVTNVTKTFFNCEYVATGALAIYQQMSTQAIPPAQHSRTFGGCGYMSETGSAEVAQIPSDWKD